MSGNQWLGVVLVLVGLVDIFLGYVVIGPRLADERARRMVQQALVVGALVLGVLGVLLLVGVLSLL